MYGSDVESLSKDLDLACVAADPVIPQVIEMLTGGTEEAEAETTPVVTDGDIQVMEYLIENIGGENGILAAYAGCGGSLFTLIEVSRAFLPHLKTGKGFDPIVALAEPSFGDVVNTFDLTCLVEHPAIQPIVGTLLETK